MIDEAQAASRLASAPLQSGEPPKDRIFYARHHVALKWVPYKPNSEQARRGTKGRWQTCGEYGGWNNADFTPQPGAWVEDVLNPPFVGDFGEPLPTQ